MRFSRQSENKSIHRLGDHPGILFEEVYLNGHVAGEDKASKRSSKLIRRSLLAQVAERLKRI